MKKICFPMRLGVIWFILFISIIRLWGQDSVGNSISVGAEPDYPPFSMLDKDSLPQGFSIDLMNAALDAMGYTADYHSDSWNHLKNALANGDIQALPLVGRTPEREELFDFTFPYIRLHGTIIYREGAFKPSSFEELEGTRVGVMKGDNAEEFMIRSSLDVDLVAAETYKDALNMLSRGELEAVVIQKLLALQLMEEMRLSNLKTVDFVLDDFVQNFCFAVQDGNSDLLNILNEGLSIIIANGRYARIEQKWFNPEGKIKPANNLIILGGDYDYPPYEYLDASGNPAGFNVELTRALAEQMNLNIEIQLAPWAETFEKLKNHEIDGVLGLFYSEERASEFSFSQPHSIINHVIFSRKNEKAVHSLDDLKGKDILVLKGDITEEYLVENELGKRITGYNSLEEALIAFSNGVGDYLAAAQVPAEYFIKSNHIQNLRLSPVQLFYSEYNYGTLNENYLLTRILSEGIKVLRESGEYRKIYRKWLDPYDPLKEDHTGLYRILLLVLVSLASIVIIALVWIYSLRKNVRRATREIHEKDATLTYILEDILDGYWYWDWELEEGYLSPGFKKEFSIPQDVVDPTEWQQYIHPDDQKEVSRQFEAHHKSKGEVSFSSEVRFLARDREIKWVLVSGRIVEWDSKGNPKKIMGGLVNTTHSQEAREKLHLLHQSIEFLYESLFICDKQGQILYCNPAFEKLTGFSPKDALGQDPGLLLGRHMGDIFNKKLLLNLKKGENWESDLRGRRKDGNSFNCHITVTPIHNDQEDIINFLTTMKDNSEDEELKNRIKQSEKMEVLGHLAGGIAHDFNNILGVIIGFCELSQPMAKENQNLAYYLELIHKSGIRAKELVAQILSFSRQAKPEVTSMKLTPIIKEVTALLKASFPSSIKIKTNIKEETYSILANPNQVHEILLNLCTNASHAMYEKGTLSIEVGTLSLTEELKGIVEVSPPGQYNYFTVKDTGEGIPDEVIDDIFKPFFTTKKEGQGTGMGLSMVYSIVKNYKGNITIESSPGKGCLFTVLFPVSVNSDMLTVKEIEIQKGNGEKIMVVDDDIELLQLMKQMLESLNYQSEVFSDPRMAFEKFSEDSPSYQLIISDMTMPEMTGLEFIKAVRTIDVRIPTIIYSGYNDPKKMKHYSSAGVDGLLEKPVRMQQLSAIIQQNLHKSEGSL